MFRLQKMRAADNAPAFAKKAALLANLAQRGLLKDTLVVYGGVEGGTHYGETDNIGHKTAVNKVSVHDFHAALLHALDLDHEKLIFPFQGLDQRLTGGEKARVVKEIFA